MKNVVTDSFQRLVYGFHTPNMELTIELARIAATQGDRPFGCLIVDEPGRVLAKSAGSESPVDPTRHCEVVAIRQACQARGRLLEGCTLYSTHEPCIMCAGAILHAKVSGVIFGSWREDLQLLFRSRNIPIEELLRDTSHPPVVVGGFLRDQCVALFDTEIEHEVARREATF